MSDEPPVVTLADAVSALFYGIAGLLLFLSGLLLLANAMTLPLRAGLDVRTVLLTAVFFGFGFVLAAGGAFVTPWFRRRMNRRHPVTTFGTVRSVDERVLRPEEERRERCTACGSPVDRGLVRRYREEYAVAGVPLYASSEGHNYYCLDCASAELGLDDPDVGSAFDDEPDARSGNGADARSESRVDAVSESGADGDALREY